MLQTSRDSNRSDLHKMTNNPSTHSKTADAPSLYDLAFYLVSQSDTGIILIDRQRQIIVWNDWIARHARVSRSNAIGMELFTVFRHMHHPRFAQALETAAAEQRSVVLDAELPTTFLPLTRRTTQAENTAEQEEPLYHQVSIKPVSGLGSDTYLFIQVMDSSTVVAQQSRLDKQKEEIACLVNATSQHEYQRNTLFEKSHDAILVIDPNGRIKEQNPAAEKTFGYSSHEFSRLSLADLISLHWPGEDDGPSVCMLPQEERKVRQANQNLIQQLTHGDSNFSGMDKNNTVFPVEIRHDITADKSQNQYMLLIKSNARLHTTVQNAAVESQRAQAAFRAISDAVITVGADNRIAFLNPAAEQLCACSKNAALGKPFHSVFKLHDEQTGNPILIADSWASNNADSLPKKRIEATLSRADHVKVPVELSIVAANSDTGCNNGLAIILHNITQRHDFDRKLAWHSTHDQLTGLINRNEFEKRLEAQIKYSKNGQHRHALLYLDLDQFKIINDTIGHAAGDELLVQITDLVKQKVKPSDLLARLGGDEFGILLIDCAIAAAHKIAQEIRQSIQDFRFQWKDKTYSVSTSIGLAPISHHCENYVTLLTCADTACFTAKDCGRNRVHIYEFDNQDLIKRRNEMQWISRLQNAMDKNNMLLFCQEIRPAQSDPQLRPRLEILLRIVDEDMLVSPAAFIPAAERYNLMPKVDRWVLRNTFEFLKSRDLSRWEAVNINLSGQSISDESFLYFLIECIKKTAVDPEFFCFEITETAAISDLNSAASFMEVLRKMGCQFALDDFGAGLSSFAYLKNLPIDFLKIDGAFVKGMNDSHVDQAMLEAINHIGHVMGIKTIAEYVESDELLAQVRAIGVDYVQGYAISRPSPLEEYF